MQAVQQYGPESVRLQSPPLSIGFTNHDLCTRCGTCAGACPEGAITNDEMMFPKLIEEKCTSCGLCAKVCPGDKVHFVDLARQTYGVEDQTTAYDGHTSHVFVGHSTTDEFRNNGAGGGIITALLWDMLKNGDVDGCIVTRMNPDKPWQGEYYIARTREELAASQGSKYTVIPVNQIMADIRHMEGRYALAALPCQVHGFRMLSEEYPELKEKVPVVVGLFCGGALEPYLVPEMMAAKGLPMAELKNFQYRGGEWPGKFRAIMKDDRIVDMHNYNYDDGAYNYIIQLYAPKRCQTCVDGSGRFADVSIGDFWTRDLNGEYIAKSRSRLLVRTPAGLRTVLNAQSRGSIDIEDISNNAEVKTHRMQRQRKGVAAPIRIQRWRAKGIAVPEYDLDFGTFTKKEQLAEQIASFLYRCGEHKWIRYPILKFLVSRWSKPVIATRRYYKKRKYARLKREALAAEAKKALVSS